MKVKVGYWIPIPSPIICNHFSNNTMTAENLLSCQNNSIPKWRLDFKNKRRLIGCSRRNISQQIHRAQQKFNYVWAGDQGGFGSFGHLGLMVLRCGEAIRETHVEGKTPREQLRAPLSPRGYFYHPVETRERQDKGMWDVLMYVLK